MANEKLMILKMLEDGKISAEEAARLMEASVQNKSMETEQAPKAPPHVPQQPRPYSEPPKDYTGLPTNERAGYTGYSKPHSGDAPWPDHGYSNGGVPPVTRGFDDFASELGRKFNAFARDMEPKLQKFTETVVEKTANMADMISKSVNADTSYPHSPAAKPAYSQERYLHPYATSPSSASAYLEKNFEAVVTPGYSELNLSGLNGDVLINGYNGDKITARVTYKPKHHNAYIELMKLGDKYYLNYDEDNFESVSVDAYVPERLFKNIKLESVNGKIYVSTVTADFVNITGINTKCDVRNVSSGELTVDNTNGEISLVSVTATKGKIDIFNGPFNATSLDVANLSVSSNNSPITLNIDYFRNFMDYTWVLEASNGKFVMNIPSAFDMGYYVKARTSLSNVKLGLTGMNYIINGPTFVEAKSYGFESMPKKARLSVETSNAPLVIN